MYALYKMSYGKYTYGVPTILCKLTPKLCTNNIDDFIQSALEM